MQPHQQVYYTQPAPVMHVGPINNGLCIASMVLGIIAAVFLWVPYMGIILGVLAVVFGAVGISIANKRGQAGAGMGIAGLVLGIVALAANIAFIIWVWHWWGSVTRYYY